MCRTAILVEVIGAAGDVISQLPDTLAIRLTILKKG